MRIPHHPTVAGKVLATGRHPGLGHAQHILPGKLGHHQRVFGKRPITDHGAYAVPEIEHRREAHIHAMGQQFGGHNITGRMGQFAPARTIERMDLADARARRKVCESRAETLDTSAFVIDCDDERGIAQGVDLGG